MHLHILVVTIVFIAEFTLLGKVDVPTKLVELIGVAVAEKRITN